jgi:predicted MFS family arabinose efflux permease
MHQKLWSKEFIAIMGSSLFMTWAFFALLPTLPIYLLENLKMSHSSVGLVIAAFSVSVILVRPIAGYLVDNYHRFGLLIISLFLITVGYGIYPLTSSVLGMLLIRFMHGAMFGICTSSSATIVADIVPPSRIGEGIGMYALSIPAGMTIGPMFGLELLKNQGPNGMFLALIGISLLAVLGAFCARIPSKPLTTRRFSLPNLFHRKAFPISFSMFFIMIAYGAIIIFVGIYAEQRGFPNVATFFLCLSAAIFLTRLFAGRLFDRGHIFHLILVGLVLTAVGVLWLGYAGNPIQFLMAGVINGFGFGILMPTCQAAINNMVRSSERGAANSTYLFSFDLGIGVGSLIIGFLFDKVSLGQIYRYSTIFILISTCVFVLIAIPHYNRNRVDSGAIS